MKKATKNEKTMKKTVGSVLLSLMLLLTCGLLGAMAVSADTDTEGAQVVTVSVEDDLEDVVSDVESQEVEISDQEDDLVLSPEDEVILDDDADLDDEDLEVMSANSIKTVTVNYTNVAPLGAPVVGGSN